MSKDIIPYHALGVQSTSTKMRIVKYAIKLFAQHDFATISLRQVAIPVGIREPSIYHHYPDKEHIMYACLNIITTHCKKHIFSILENEALSMNQQIMHFVSRLKYYFSNEPAAILVSKLPSQDIINSNAIIRAYVRDYATLWVENIAEMLVLLGYTSREAKKAAHHTFMLLNGSITQGHFFSTNTPIKYMCRLLPKIWKNKQILLNNSFT